MTQKFTLPERKESHARWETNKVINEMISKAFHDSLAEKTNTYMQVNCRLYHMECIKSEQNRNIPYSCSTLERSGCAVACMHNGLLSREMNVTLEQVTKEMAEKGYYEPGKGTYHNVFDHYGLRRATHIQEVFDCLSTKDCSVVTMLLENSCYNGGEGRHFVNVTYYDRTVEEFWVLDPNNNGIAYVPKEKILNAVQIAWIW